MALAKKPVGGRPAIHCSFYVEFGSALSRYEPQPSHLCEAAPLELGATCFLRTLEPKTRFPEEAAVTQQSAVWPLAIFLRTQARSESTRQIHSSHNFLKVREESIQFDTIEKSCLQMLDIHSLGDEKEKMYTIRV